MRWRSVLLFLVLPAALLYPCMSFLLFEPDEGRYAEIPREMLARGEWIVPYLQGEPYLDKPPLLYWMVIGSYKLFGVHDWSARLVPALAVHATILLTYLLGRRSLGERAAFWGALALCLAPGFISVGKLLVLDGLLALWATLSLLAGLEAVRANRFHRRWWTLAASACGLGFLTKGPISVVLFLAPLVLHCRLTGKARPIGWRGWLVLAGIILGINLPWYVAMGSRLPEFGVYFFWKQNFLRFLMPFDHLEPMWFYMPILAGGLLPAFLLAIPFLRFLFSGRPHDADRRCPELGYMVLAGGWCVLFFSLSGSKLPTYILPAFPFLALGLGYYISISSWSLSGWTKSTVGLALVFLIGLHYLGIPWYAEFHSPMSRQEEIRRYCADNPVICYPRPCDSVAFYLGRDDFLSYRSKETKSLLTQLKNHPRTTVIFTHRHSPDGLNSVLPAANLHMKGLTPICKSWASFFKIEECKMAVIEQEDHEK
ncbi:MAG TPA: glycosyltransferase family 39 protein [Gemmataceae bacterium]|nr:glycosyltransferase family 39 protein [Gemmataceae bacterium]